MVQRDYDDKFVLSYVVLNLIQDMNRFRVRPGMTVAAISVLFTIILAGLACDSGGSTDGDDSCDAPKDDRPAWCDDNADTTDNPGSDADVQGYCGDGVCSANENCDGCDFDCPCADDEVCTDGVCGEDPLTDYYWLEGTWKPEVDGRLYDDYEDVEIKSFDPLKGAEVWGFSPMNQSFIKKNPETSEFIFSAGPEGSKDEAWAKGFADPVTLTVEFELHNAALGNYVIYRKF